VKKAVEECREAYIRTRMVTGDAVLTAKAIAKSVSIITADGDPEYQVMEGAEFMTKIGDLIKICKHCRQQNCNCTDKVKKKRKEKVEK
jgi:magnesium-transporting ATPase (P-type)